MSKRRSFKGWELQDFQKYCNDNYAGMSRDEIQKADYGFFMIIYKRGLQDKILPEKKRKPNDHWKDINNVQRGLNIIIEELGRFPITTTEIETRNPGLYGGIHKYHGGIRKIRELYGEKELRKPDGYWKDIENVQKELEPIIEELGRFPTTTEIETRDSRLYRGIHRYHGGIREVRKFYGEVDPTKPKDHWKDINNVQKGLEPIIEELGRFPTTTEIETRNSGLCAGIQICHGGIREVRKLYGEINHNKPDGHWKDINNVQKELEPIIEELGRFPTTTEIRKRDSGLCYGIEEYHGGIREVRKLYGEVDPQKPSGYWKNTENVQKGLEPIIEELGRFPKATEIRKRDSGLYAGIQKYHGNLTQVKIQLGYADKEMEVLKEVLEELGDA